MTFDLFGYNGVIELDQVVVNKVLGTFVYDRHLVEPNGQISDGDFFSVSVPLEGGSAAVYLELARPFAHVSSADGTNLVTLHLPFTDIGVYVTQNGVPQRLSVPKLALVLFNIGIQKSQQGLTVDFSKLTGDDVGLMLARIVPGPTDVGGTEDPRDVVLLVDDPTLDAFLVDPDHPDDPPPITAKAVRAKLAEFLSTGAFGTTAIPVDAGGIASQLAQWDLMLFGNADDRDVNDAPGPAGADLLLFQDPQDGVGERTQAGFILPEPAEPPSYGWSMNMSASVLLSNIDAALDRDTYWVQRDTLNTPANPFGYMVVPGKQQTAYALPSGAGKAIVNASQSGSVTVEFIAGALTPHSRAHVTNLNRQARVDFTADKGGAATISIRADAGERLALTVDAASLPNDSETVIWRPQISFHEGELQLDVHYYHYIEHWCDAEGDASLRVAIIADRTKPFGVSLNVIDADASAPWWVYVVAWLGSDLLGLGVFSPILLALVPSIVHLLAKDLIGDKVSAAADALQHQVAVPTIENLAMVLDQIDVHESGIQLTGRADSGMLLAWGRQPALASEAGIVLQATQPNPVYMRFDWRPSLSSIEMTYPRRWKTIRDQAVETFWSATYDNLDTTTLNRDPVTLRSGDAMMAWVEIERGHAKVLFEWPASQNDVISTGLRVTWIAYRERVQRHVKLASHIVATKVGGTESTTLEVSLWSYHGTIDLERHKAFFSDETRALGNESWTWDGQVVTERGISVPGGSIVLDAVNRRLFVDLDQAGLVGNDQPPTSLHWVEFKGVDVFGHALSHKILVQTPAQTLRPRPIGIVGPPSRIDPLGDPIPDRLFDPAMADVLAALTARLGEPTAAGVLRALGNALVTGSATLDGASALGLVSVLSQLR